MQLAYDDDDEQTPSLASKITKTSETNPNSRVGLGKCEGKQQTPLMPVDDDTVTHFDELHRGTAQHTTMTGFPHTRVNILVILVLRAHRRQCAGRALGYVACQAAGAAGRYLNVARHLAVLPVLRCLARSRSCDMYHEVTITLHAHLLRLSDQTKHRCSKPTRNQPASHNASVCTKL